MSAKYKSNEEVPLSSDEKVATAVSFLSDVAQKKYRAQDLRKYLANKRGLSNSQIDEAFRIHRTQQNAKPPGERKSRLKYKAQKVAFSKSNLAIAERKELSTPSTGSTGSLKDIVSILIKSKQAEGSEMLQKFVESERDYCSILECLENEYHQELNKLAVTGKIRMARREVQEIFRLIPDLIKFHTSFYEELYQGRNIGYLFIRHFNVFKGYIEYMKNCKLSIDIIRKYLRDRNLQKQLAFIRQRSRRKRDDMVDLLLVPLDRIMECKTVLDKLSEWADSEQKDNFSTIRKANRRIGRVANYIERYKYGISNRNEMNKVQLFLERQCDIISPNRIIIRRGTMIRRTTGWAARNKTYVFFLFNDVLLWTTQNRELQNIVQLVSCTVMPSESKTDPERKFKIVSIGRKIKTLLLECTSKRQRDDWYEAAEKGIRAAKMQGEKETAQQKFDAPSEDSDWAEGQALSSPEPVASAEQYDSKESPPVEKRSHIRKLSELAATHPGTPPLRSQPGTPVNRSQPGSPVAFDWQASYNFGDQFLKDFDPFDDTTSQMSEIENDTIERPGKGKDQSTVALLSPFIQNASVVGEEGKRPSKVNYMVKRDQNRMPINRNSHTVEKIVRHDDRQMGSQNQQSRDNYTASRRGNIVRRGKKETVKREHDRKSSFTLRLNDL